MTTIAKLRSWAREELRQVASDSVSGLIVGTLALDVDLLLLHTLRLDSRADLILKKDECLSESQEAVFKSYLERRKNSEPIAYIIGVKEFRGLEFEVDRTVLIPRPETELVVEVALDYFEKCFSISASGRGQSPAPTGTCQTVDLPVGGDPSTSSGQEFHLRLGEAEKKQIANLPVGAGLCPHPHEAEKNQIVDLPVGAGLCPRPQLSSTFQVVDIGTGSGAIILALASELREKYGEKFLECGELFAIDISAAALCLAKKNAEKFNLLDYVKFIESDLLEQDLLGRFMNRPYELLCEQKADSTTFPKLYLSNPPYVAPSEKLQKNVLDYEPRLALFAGDEGLEIIGRIISSLADELREGAILIMEIGDNQQASVESLLRAQGLENFNWHYDLRGVARVIEVRST